MKRTLKCIALTAALIVFVAFVVLSFVQPLLPSRAYRVTATLDGAPIRAELLRPPAIPGTYYLRLPVAQADRYSWFGIAFSRQAVFSPLAVYFDWRGTPFIHTDQAKGVRLSDTKTMTIGMLPLRPMVSSFLTRLLPSRSRATHERSA